VQGFRLRGPALHLFSHPPPTTPHDRAQPPIAGHKQLQGLQARADYCRALALE
jgi:hypothetical protein